MCKVFLCARKLAKHCQMNFEPFQGCLDYELWIKSSWPSDSMWHHGPWPPLVEVTVEVIAFTNLVLPKRRSSGIHPRAIPQVMCLISVINSSSPEQNGRHFTEDIFKHIFMNEKNLYFDSNFTGVSCKGFNWQEVSIGPGNGLAPNRGQTIIWTNANPVHQHIHVALGGDELN